MAYIPFVAGHVHEPNLAAVSEVQMCEPHVCCHAAEFLDREAVRVASREPVNESGLAVVCVAPESHHAGDESSSIHGFLER